MSQINYRPATLTDLPTLYEFEQGIVSTERPMDPVLIAGHINYYDLKAMIESETSEVLVAEVNDKIAGSGYVTIRQAAPYLKFEQYAYVGFMYVLPAYRRKGISQGVIEHLKAWAQSKNLTELRLNVYQENPIAIAAYEKIGMKKHTVEMRMGI